MSLFWHNDCQIFSSKPENMEAESKEGKMGKMGVVVPGYQLRGFSEFAFKKRIIKI